MKSWQVISCDGRSTIITAYTESDARQQADDFCGDDGINSFEEVL
jgi:hypothetical protein